jgi:hypothetical protein
MSTFADRLLLQFSDDNFVQDLLTNQLGLAAIFNLIYTVEDIDLKQIALVGTPRRIFEVPAFETIRTNGTDEKLVPTTERIRVERAQPRYGRLAWVDVLLDVLVSTQVESQVMPIERINAQNLLDKLGGVASIVELRAKLATLYPPSVVDAFFNRLRITSVDDFKSHPSVFLEFVYQAPPPFDPTDPHNVRTFQLNVCMQFQPELHIGEALQAAKLCRSILENERDFMDTFEGGEIETPYAFVVIFADSTVVDGALPNLTAVQIKAGMRSLFQAERMLAHFM